MCGSHPAAADLLLRSETASNALSAVRVGGGVAFVLAGIGGVTRAARIAEADGWRLRFPRSSLGCEAVLINTGGGIAGGDRVRITAELQAGTTAIVTSAAAERVYRAIDRAAEITVSLSLAEGARLAWLPQETILSSGAALKRDLRVDMADDACLTLVDCLVLGRRASGERMTMGDISDRWMIRRGGRLIHLDAIRLDGAIDTAMQRPAIGNGAHVIATLLHVAADASDRLPAVRDALAQATASAKIRASLRTAASAWNGRLVVRVLANRSDHARAAIAAAASQLIGHAMPRAWTT